MANVSKLHEDDLPAFVTEKWQWDDLDDAREIDIAKRFFAAGANHGRREIPAGEIVCLTPSDVRGDVDTPKMRAIRAGAAYAFFGFDVPSQGDPEMLLRARLMISEGMTTRAEFLGEDASTKMEETRILEAAIERMGWPEINAFLEELNRGQDVHEDGGGYWIRAIRRLFGLPTSRDEVTTYHQAAKAMIEAASPASQR